MGKKIQPMLEARASQPSLAVRPANQQDSRALQTQPALGRQLQSLVFFLQPHRAHAVPIYDHRVSRDVAERV
jgi:hypothetical protein